MILLIPNVSMLRQWNWWVIVTVTLVRLWGSLGLGPALYPPFAAVVRKTTARVQAGYDGGMPVRFVASLLTLAGGDGPSQTTGKMPPDPKRRCVASAPCPPHSGRTAGGRRLCEGLARVKPVDRARHAKIIPQPVRQRVSRDNPPIPASSGGGRSGIWSCYKQNPRRPVPGGPVGAR